MRLFRLKYVRVDLWRKFIEMCEWYDGGKEIFNFKKMYKM